jgi:hypothetical protein
VEGSDFTFLRYEPTVSRTALGPTHFPIQWIPGALSLGVKQPAREPDHSLPPSAEVKHAWSYTSAPSYVFMAWCLVKYMDNFTFTYRKSVGTGMVQWYRPGLRVGWGFDSWQGLKLFSHHRVQTTDLLSNGYQELLLWGQSCRGVKLTTHLHLVTRLRMRGAILALPQYAFITWYSLKIKHRDKFHLLSKMGAFQIHIFSTYLMTLILTRLKRFDLFMALLS